MYVSTITSNTISTSSKFIGTKGTGNGFGVANLPRTRSAVMTTVRNHPYRLAARAPPSHAPRMFVVTEAEAAAIRTFEQRGELSAAVELRRLFPGITDNVQAHDLARSAQ